MNELNSSIKRIALYFFKNKFQVDLDENNLVIQPTRKEFEGDVTIILFPVVKLLKRNPKEIGEALGQFLAENTQGVSHFNVAGGFLNLSIAHEYWLKAMNSASNRTDFGFQKAQSTGKTYMVEYSSPNTNKPLHLGHLRNIFLGYSVANILKANGHEVYKTQIINDRGIHICKSMLAYEKWGKDETPESSGLKGDKLVGKYYVEFEKNNQKAAVSKVKEIIHRGEEEQEAHNYIQPTLVASLYRIKTSNILNQENISFQDLIDLIPDEGKVIFKEHFSLHNDLMDEARKMLKKWEEGDKEVVALWQKMNGWVYDGFEQTYQTMGVDFDKLYYESDTYLIGRDIVLEGANKKIFDEKEDGSIWVNLKDEGLDEKLLLRADGTSVYMTQDIGTAVLRYQDYPSLSGLIYTVGNEQDYHFQVLFKILKKLGYAWADGCYHLSYGMVDLPSGKMKSREGTVVDADDLMASVVEDAKEMTQERGHIQDMDETQREALYKTIGLGGLKYYLLKVDPKKRMLFDPKESIDLNGNTGPFIQYGYARIQSILRKTEVPKTLNTNIQLSKQELDVLKTALMFPETIREAGENYSPAVICNYCYDLVKQYNSFYQSFPILGEENEDLKQFRIKLSSFIARIIEDGMQLIGVSTPNQM